MNKKSIALIVIGVVIGAFCMVGSWSVIAAIPDDTRQCRFIHSLILYDYDMMFGEEAVEYTSLVMRSLIRNMDHWEESQCDLVIPEMAPAINEIQDLVLNDR